MLTVSSTLAHGTVGGRDREHVGLGETVLGECAVDGDEHARHELGRDQGDRRTAESPPPVIRAPIAP